MNADKMRKGLRLMQQDAAADLRLSDEIKRLWKQKFHQFQITGLKEGISGKWKLDHFGPIGVIEEMRSMFGGQWIDPDKEYTRLCFKGDHKPSGRKDVWVPMMSDTPSELFDHLEYYNMVFLTFAKRVLIHGLGLGCAIEMALHLKVEHIDVVEIDWDVIELVGYKYKDDNRVSIWYDDAFKKKWPPRTKWDVVWHDIWAHICKDNLPEIATLKRKFGGRSRWQGAWSEKRIRDHQKQDARWKKLHDEVQMSQSKSNT